MHVLIRILLVVNLIVITSCAVSKTITIVKESTATAKATSNGGSSTATAKTKVTNTTTIYNRNPGYEYYGNCNGTLKNVIDAVNSFAFHYLNYSIETSDTSEDKTSLPMNTFVLTCHLAYYSYGQSWRDAKAFCGVRTKKQLKCALKVFRNNFYTNDNAPEGIEYLYGLNVGTNYNLTDTFIRRLKELTTATGRQYNFMKPVEVTMMVNKMISKQTNGRVRKAITKPSIFNNDPFAKKMVFASGVFLEATWQTACDSSNLMERDYYDMENNRHRVPYVNRKTIYNYTYFADSDVVSIPFVSGFFNCVVFIPRKRCASKLAKLIQILKVPGVFKTVVARLRPACIHFIAPYFNDASTETDLSGGLKSTGQLDSFFDPNMSEIENSNGERLDNFYLGAAQLRIILRNTLSEVSPNKGYSNIEDLKTCTTLIADHSVIIAFENQAMIRVITIGAVRKKEDHYV